MKNIPILIICIIVIGGAIYFLMGARDINDTTEPITSDFPIYGETILQTGESKTIGSLTLTLLGVPEDYRCPVDVQCIQAGAIVARVQLEANEETLETNLPSDEVPFAFQDHFISILDISPEARSGQTIDQEDYSVTFNIQSRNAEENEITWAEAVGIIASGEVSMVVQTDDRQVKITKKDGTMVTTREPEIDDVFEVIRQCGQRCEDIIVATE